MRSNRIQVKLTFAMALGGLIAAFVPSIAQTTGPIMRFTATSESVSGAGDAIRIDLLRWSTDAERDQLLSAWNLTAPPANAARGGAAAATDAGGRGGAGGAGGGRGGAGGGRGGAGGGGGRGGAPPAAAAQPPAQPAAQPPAQATDAPAAAATDAAAPARGAGAGGGGRGGGAAGGGRGGRGGAAAADGGAAGGGRGGAPPAPAAPETPESALTAALQRATTVGYLWTSESAGYSLRFAYRLPQPDGTERIILATERRLGAFNSSWKPTGTVSPNDYQFTIIELRLNAKGEGEGKASLANKVAVDAAAKTLALDGYATAPVVLKGVKRQASTN
jgi:hypothetical protein